MNAPAHRNTQDIMNSTKLLNLVVVTLLLAFAAVGCKKKPEKTTVIPRTGGVVDTGTPAPPRDLPPSTPVIPTDPGAGFTGIDRGPGGVPAAHDAQFTGWNEQRDVFSAQTVYFDFDKSTIKASELPKLETVAGRMKSEFAGKGLRIEGHCDERGTEEYNRALGDRRANSIREKLVALGVPPDKLPVVSFGENRPVDPGHNDTAWKKNRRGELILLTPPGAAN
jgi:peptidoglycan-associated lipoprotein